MPDAIRQARIVEPNLPAVTGQVEMVGDVATLNGTIATAAGRASGRDRQETDGVKSVNDSLKVAKS